MSQKYDEYLEKHRSAVKKAYQWISENIPELTDTVAGQNIEFHDMSKNQPDEYDSYDAYFYGTRTSSVTRDFNKAWLFHIHRNPHHWQHWILINDDFSEGMVAIEIPYHYVIEMICDWWSFSWIKGDLSEIFSWYDDHKDHMILHNNTRALVNDILEELQKKLKEVNNNVDKDDFFGCL